MSKTKALFDLPDGFPVSTKFPFPGGTLQRCHTGQDDSESVGFLDEEGNLHYLYDGDVVCEVVEVEAEHTGGSSSYYGVQINNPTTQGNPPYFAECNDIIEALGMNFAQGNAFKAIWRMAAAENHGKLKKGNNGVYDAEKVVFFGQRLVVQQKVKAGVDKG